jgi:hypothetical protein
MAVKEETASKMRIAGITRKEILEVLRPSTRYTPEMEHWTRPELLEVYKEEIGPRNTGSQIDQDVNRLSRCKKAEIQEYLLEMGLELDMTETIGQMLMKYRARLKCTMPAEPDEVVDFGQHKGKTFAEVQTKFPDYAVWVRDQFYKGPDSCSPGLRRLACWLEGIHPGSQTPNTGATSSGNTPLKAKVKAKASPVVKQEPEETPSVRPKRPTAVKSAAKPSTHRGPGESWMAVEPQHFNLSTDGEENL